MEVEGRLPRRNDGRRYPRRWHAASVANFTRSLFQAQVRRLHHSIHRARSGLRRAVFSPPNANHDRGPSRRHLPVIRVLFPFNVNVYRQYALLPSLTVAYLRRLRPVCLQ